MTTTTLQPQLDAAPPKRAKKGGWKLGSLASPEGAIILTGAAAAAVAGVVATGGTRDEAASPQD